MILGFVHVDAENGSVETHRDSYLLDTLTVVSVRRPFMAGGVMFGGGFAGFALMFADLLYAHEMALIGGVALIVLWLGWQAGQLKLLSRDLRGSELSGVIWGRYADLNAARSTIVRALGARRMRVLP